MYSFFQIDLHYYKDLTHQGIQVILDIVVPEISQSVVRK